MSISQGNIEITDKNYLSVKEQLDLFLTNRIQDFIKDNGKKTILSERLGKFSTYVDNTLNRNSFTGKENLYFQCLKLKKVK